MTLVNSFVPTHKTFPPLRVGVPVFNSTGTESKSHSAPLIYPMFMRRAADEGHSQVPFNFFQYEVDTLGGLRSHTHFTLEIACSSAGSFAFSTTMQNYFIIYEIHKNPTDGSVQSSIDVTTQSIISGLTSWLEAPTPFIDNDGNITVQFTPSLGIFNPVATFKGMITAI